MRRARVWLLFAGLFALAFVATIDALRGDGGKPRASRPTTTDVEAAVTEGVESAALRERGVSGILYVTEKEPDGCSLLALRLPDLDVEAEVETRLCRIDAGPAGRVALSSGCPGTSIELRTVTGDLLERPLSGCAPAWAPGGVLTFVSRGSVVTLDSRCSIPGHPCFRPLLSKRAIESELRAAPTVPSSHSYSIREIGWLGPSTLAAIIRTHTGAESDSIAIFRGGNLVRGTTPGPLRPGMYVSPRAAEVIVRAGPRGRGFLVLDRYGFVTRVDPIPDADRAYARSPDERWTAVASPDRVHIFPTGEDEPDDPVTLRLAAVDLAWGAD